MMGDHKTGLNNASIMLYDAMLPSRVARVATLIHAVQVVSEGNV